MISFTVRMTFRPEDRADIENILREITRLSRQEPGCVTYIPLWVEGESATVVIWEQYKDDAAAEHHRGTDHFARYAIGGLYQKMLERHVENLTAVS